MVLRDALEYLPRARIAEYPRGMVVYDATRPPDHFYLVLAGQVQLFCTSGHGAQTLLRVVCPEHFFGEYVLISPPVCDWRETALVTEPPQLMSWTAEELQHHIEHQPLLGLALCQYFVTHHRMMMERLTGMISSSNMRTRVMWALLQLARSVGVPTPAGALRLHGLTHQVIAAYVGTTLEMVTREMTRLRSCGYVSYKRQSYLDVYPARLSQGLEEESTTPTSAKKPQARRRVAPVSLSQGSVSPGPIPAVEP